MNSTNKKTITYDVKKTSRGMKEGYDNEYEIIRIPEKHRYKFAGDYIIKVYGNDTLIAEYNQICIPKDYLLYFLNYNFEPNHIPVLETAKFIVTGTDDYLNKLSDVLLDHIKVDLSIDKIKVDPEEYKVEYYEIIPGELHINLDVHKVGTYQIHMYYNRSEIKIVNINKTLPFLHLSKVHAMQIIILILIFQQ